VTAPVSDEAQKALADIDEVLAFKPEHGGTAGVAEVCARLRACIDRRAPAGSIYRKMAEEVRPASDRKYNHEDTRMRAVVTALRHDLANGNVTTSSTSNETMWLASLGDSSSGQLRDSSELLRFIERGFALGREARLLALIAREASTSPWRAVLGRIDLVRRGDPPANQIHPRGNVQVVDERPRADVLVARLAAALKGEEFVIGDITLAEHGMNNPWMAERRHDNGLDYGTEWPCLLVAPLAGIKNRPYIDGAIEADGPTPVFMGLERLAWAVSRFRASSGPGLDVRPRRFQLLAWDYRGRIDQFRSSRTKLYVSVTPPGDPDLRLVAVAQGRQGEVPLLKDAPGKEELVLDEPLIRARATLRHGEDVVVEHGLDFPREHDFAQLQGYPPLSAEFGEMPPEESLPATASSVISVNRSRAALLVLQRELDRELSLANGRATFEQLAPLVEALARDVTEGGVQFRALAQRLTPPVSLNARQAAAGQTAALCRRLHRDGAFTASPPLSDNDYESFLRAAILEDGKLACGQSIPLRAIQKRARCSPEILHAATARALDEQLAYVSDVDERAYSIQIQQEDVEFALAELANASYGKPSARASGDAAVVHGADDIDIGILTIREDEFRAVLAAFPDGKELRKQRRHYNVRTADAGSGRSYRVAILRQLEHGNGEAQEAARDMIDELQPTLILVVGIAGGLPHDDFTLGDVVVSTRINDYSVEARKEGEAPSYNLSGGPIATHIAAGVANLPALEEELGDWVGGLPTRPRVDVAGAELKGPPEWQTEVRQKLVHHFADGRSRQPVATAGILASSDRLVKDPTVLFPWIQTARHLLAVEMESAGVYRAARDRAFMLAVRGISDIIGLKRDDGWTKYACASAAAFARAYLRTTPVAPKKTTASPMALPTTPDRQQPTGSRNEPELSERAAEIMLFLAGAYVKAGYPNFKVWMFTPPNQDDQDYGELRALGLVYFGGPRGGPWRLTEEGVRWIMANRSATPRETTEEALLRVMHEHADENGEVTATWTEIREWLGGSSADIHAAVILLKEKGHFCSQMLEGSPDGMCSVVLRR
jgi:nucleoside phosphorylase